MAEYNLRSDCPVNFALEIFGDKWSLLIIRDMIFAGKCTYNEFLESPEKIATNILSSRLKMLEEAELIEKRHDPSRRTKTKTVYLLTQKSIDLIPLLVEMMLWSNKHWSFTDPLQITQKARHNKQQTIDELSSAAEAKLAGATF